MALIQPLALALAAAGLIPLAIHLLVRRRGRIVPFPSLRFLTASSARRLAPGRLTHPWLLASRVLFIALLALLLARPYWGGAVARGLAERRVRVVVLDRSLSMGAGGAQRRGLEAARAALAELGPRDQAALVHYGGRALVATEPGDPAVSLAALSELSLETMPEFPDAIPGEGSAHGAALIQALRIVQGVPGRQEIIWISDFRGAEFESLTRRAAEAGVEWTSLPLEDSAGRNDAPAAVRFEESGGAWRLSVSIDRFDAGSSVAEQVGWTLANLRETVLDGALSDGRGIHVRLITVTPHRVRIQVALDPGDSLAQDDVAAFAVEFRQRVVVAVLGPDARYALAAIEAAVEVDGLHVSLASSVESADLLIVTDRSRIGAEVGRSIQTAAGRGAAVLIAGAIRSEGELRRLAPWSGSNARLESVLETSSLPEPQDEDEVLARFRDGSVAARRGGMDQIQLAFALTGPPRGLGLADGFPELLESLMVELVPAAAAISAERSTMARLESALEAPAPPANRPATTEPWVDPELLEAETGLAIPLALLLLTVALVEGWLARRVAVSR